MERNGDDSIRGGDAIASSNAGVAGETSVVSSNLILDRVGEVALALDPDGLSWKLLETQRSVSAFFCFQECVDECSFSRMILSCCF